MDIGAENPDKEQDTNKISTRDNDNSHYFFFQFFSESLAI